jgi:hypothetical protein
MTTDIEVCCCDAMLRRQRDNNNMLGGSLFSWTCPVHKKVSMDTRPLPPSTIHHHPAAPFPRPFPQRKMVDGF